MFFFFTIGVGDNVIVNLLHVVFTINIWRSKTGSKVARKRNGNL
jgi:hypothetical protein